MLRIRNFVFNSFMVNTYILWDDTGEGVIIDAGCYEKKEQNEIVDFLSKEKVKLVRNINTHCHVDHILGNGFIFRSYGLFPEYHRASIPFMTRAAGIAISFGYSLDHTPEPKRFLEDDEIIHFGNSSLLVMYTPGHADGSVCLYNEPGQFVITGDVLFKETIGRTDLPSGDFDLLMKSIKTKLFTLPDEVVVYPGHGPETSIGYEKTFNPFIR
jgi:hydroxyacylglutathione hydrolase